MPCALDDLVAVTEADHRPRVPLLVPQRGDLVLKMLVLRGELGVVSAGEPVQYVGSAIGEPVDVVSDLVKRAHDSKNEFRSVGIPGR